MFLRGLPLLVLAACASAPPVATSARTTTAMVSGAPVTAPAVVITPSAMPQPPPPPPAKKSLGSKERIPLVDVAKAVTANRRVVVVGLRKEAVLADFKEEDFTGFADVLPPKRGGTFDELALLPHDVVIADIDGDEPPVILCTYGYEDRAAVIVRWRHHAGTRLFLDVSYVDARCHEVVCDAFTIYGKTLPKDAWDFGDLPLVELDRQGRRQ